MQNARKAADIHGGLFPLRNARNIAVGALVAHSGPILDGCGAKAEQAAERERRPLRLHRNGHLRRYAVEHHIFADRARQTARVDAVRGIAAARRIVVSGIDGDTAAHVCPAHEAGVCGTAPLRVAVNVGEKAEIGGFYAVYRHKIAFGFVIGEVCGGEIDIGVAAVEIETPLEGHSSLLSAADACKGNARIFRARRLDDDVRHEAVIPVLQGRICRSSFRFVHSAALRVHVEAERRIIIGGALPLEDAAEGEHVLLVVDGIGAGEQLARIGGENGARFHRYGKIAARLYVFDHAAVVVGAVAVGYRDLFFVRRALNAERGEYARFVDDGNGDDRVFGNVIPAPVGGKHVRPADIYGEGAVFVVDGNIGRDRLVLGGAGARDGGERGKNQRRAQQRRQQYADDGFYSQTLHADPSKTVNTKLPVSLPTPEICS